MSLFFCLQFCPIDQEEALLLANIIADNEPNPRYDVEIGISYRPDTDPNHVRRIKEVLERKFNHVFVNKSKRTGTGWPHGCNDLWYDTMHWVYDLRRSGKIKATGVLTFEADNFPLKRDWINILKSEWNAKGAGRFAVGNVCEAQPGVVKHVNGNGMFSIKMQDALGSRMNGCPANRGWDTYMAPLIVPRSEDTNELYQLYRKSIESLDELAAVNKNGHRPALLHGLKGIHHYALCREWLLLSEDQIAKLERIGSEEAIEMKEVEDSLEESVNQVTSEKDDPDHEKDIDPVGESEEIDVDEGGGIVEPEDSNLMKGDV